MYSPCTSTLDTLIWTVRLVTDSGSEKSLRLNGRPFENPASPLDLTLELIWRIHMALRISLSPRYLHLRYTTSPRTAVTFCVIAIGPSLWPETQSSTTRGHKFIWAVSWNCKHKQISDVLRDNMWLFCFLRGQTAGWWMSIVVPMKGVCAHPIVFPWLSEMVMDEAD